MYFSLVVELIAPMIFGYNKNKTKQLIRNKKTDAINSTTSFTIYLNKESSNSKMDVYSSTFQMPSSFTNINGFSI